MKELKTKSIRDTAAREFVKRGLENTTTRDIARAAEISTASVYYYFVSKENLLYQILDQNRIEADQRDPTEPKRNPFRSSLT